MKAAKPNASKLAASTSNVTQLRPASVPAPSNGQRALWTFLMITLVAPFLAALVIFLASMIAAAFGRGPASLLALDRAGQLGWSATKALETYVWGALPAGLGGAAIAAMVYLRGSVPWLAAATAGAVPVSVMAALAGGMLQQHLSMIAFIGAVVGIAMWALLKRVRILS
jgi:hypothetical protein